MPAIAMPHTLTAPGDPDHQKLRDRYHHARMITSQRARWDASDPGREPNTCRYCGRHWIPWAGSKLDGHAACVVTPEFKAHVAELLRAPSISYAKIAAIIGVSASVVRSWTLADKPGRGS